MVIANSDSNGTLVSLGNALKRVASLEGLQRTAKEDLVLRQTRLYLANDDNGLCMDHDDDDCRNDTIYLPAASSTGVDECLQCLPAILDARDELLTPAAVHFDRYSPERILYVGQGEVGYAVPSQCDVILSDRATTCHILALRSSTSSNNNNNNNNNASLVSVAHIDAPKYDDCIRDMILRHVAHHHQADNKTAAVVDIAIHLVGGFDDLDESSRAISNWLIHLLADIAEEHADTIRLTLRDCAISCLNNCPGQCAPVGRGLAIDMATGHAFLASCDMAVAGPSAELRAVRLFAGSHNNKKPQLSVIHTPAADAQQQQRITIAPFAYAPFSGISTLLRLPDDQLLECCSTSPDCEQDDFCVLLRSTLRVLRDVPCRRVFGKACDRPLVYERVGRTNQWVLVNC